MKATARAHSNIALVKYWGKRSTPLNLPMNGSISLTLDKLHTTTTVEWDPNLKTDEVTLNDQILGEEEVRPLSNFLDLVRQQGGMDTRARITTFNNFPTAAGLASSASGFAALALASSHAAGLKLDPQALSLLARRGSGSAARSIWGGFSEWRRGEREDGRDSYAQPLEASGLDDLKMLVTVLEPGPKPLSSRNGMNRTTETSPMYPAWQETVDLDLAGMRRAIASGDFMTIGRIAEANCLKMHATMLTSQPFILYWQPTTVALMHRVASLRAEGFSCFFTIDAGPNVKVLCHAKEVEAIARALKEEPGVKAIIRCKRGPGAHLL